MATSTRSLTKKVTPALLHKACICSATRIISLVAPPFCRNWIVSAPPAMASSASSTWERRHCRTVSVRTWNLPTFFTLFIVLYDPFQFLSIPLFSGESCGFFHHFRNPLHKGMAVLNDSPEAFLIQIVPVNAGGYDDSSFQSGSAKFRCLFDQIILLMPHYTDDRGRRTHDCGIFEAPGGVGPGG